METKTKKTLMFSIVLIVWTSINLLISILSSSLPTHLVTSGTALHIISQIFMVLHFIALIFYIVVVNKMYKETQNKTFKYIWIILLVFIVVSAFTVSIPVGIVIVNHYKIASSEFRAAVQVVTYIGIVYKIILISVFIWSIYTCKKNKKLLIVK